MPMPTMTPAELLNQVMLFLNASGIIQIIIPLMGITIGMSLLRYVMSAVSNEVTYKTSAQTYNPAPDPTPEPVRAVIQAPPRKKREPFYRCEYCGNTYQTRPSKCKGCGSYRVFKVED